MTFLDAMSFHDVLMLAKGIGLVAAFAAVVGMIVAAT